VTFATGKCARAPAEARATASVRPNDSAKIVRILDAVKQDDETFLTVASAGVGGGEDILDRGCGACGSEGDDTLMIFRTGEPIDLGAILEAQGDVPTARELDDLLDAHILASARDDNAIERAAGCEGFADGVNSRQAVHKGDSLQARMPSGKQRREQIEHQAELNPARHRIRGCGHART
jgi:hypothetical protein